MLEHFFISRRTMKHLRANCLGGIIDEMAAHLHAEEYSWHSGRNYLRAAADFGRWLDSRSIRPQLVRAKHVERFMAAYAPMVRPPPSPARIKNVSHAAGLQHLLRTLQIKYPPPKPSYPAAVSLEAFGEYLLEYRGMAPITQRGTLRLIKKFLGRYF